MSKFQNLEAFHNPTENYHLLPFKFRKFRFDYILTNLVGEYLITSKDNLKKIINKKLTPNSEIYNELKSKHFIFDSNSKSAIDLLTLKYRTKKNYLSEFTGLHIFVVTLIL